MKTFLRITALLIIAFLSACATAQEANHRTRAEYQFTNGKEVMFLSTIAENPNIPAIQDAMKANGFADFDKLPDSAANDVWCRISSITEAPFLLIECYQPQQGHTSALRDTFDPTASGTADYSGLIGTVDKLRQDLRAKLHK